MEEIEEEFRLKEQKGDKFDAEEERKELAAINWGVTCVAQVQRLAKILEQFKT